MHVPINVKSPNNISEWQMEFNSAFKGLRQIPKCSGTYVIDKLISKVINKLVSYSR